MSVGDCTVVRPGFPRPFPGTPTNVLEQFQLRGRVAAVTGAAEGLGGAAVDAYAEAGADVALLYNSNPAAVARAEGLAKQHGVRARAYKVDGKPDYWGLGAWV